MIENNMMFIDVCAEDKPPVRVRLLCTGHPSPGGFGPNISTYDVDCYAQLGIDQERLP